MDVNIIEHNGLAVVSSRTVAHDFEKRHDHVLRDIGNLIESGNPILGGEFFIKSTYENRGKKYKEYLLTRNGFSLLVMGFTGKQALQWKLKYIDAFNKMEELLKSQVPQITAEDKSILTIIKSTSQEERMMALIEYKDIVTKPLVEKIELDAPKVDAFDTYMDKDGLYTVTNVSKLLNIKRKDLYEWLRDNALVYKHKCVCTVKAQKLEIAKMKINNGHDSLYITPKGVEYIRNKFVKED